MIIDVDPKVDYAFKHLFGRDKTRSLLIDLLDSVLSPDPAHRIRDIEIQNPFNPKEALDDKLSILDIKARDESGRQFNVEMQVVSSPAYEKRILYYWARLHVQQLRQGQDYPELRPTISISFLDHVRFSDVADYHLCFRLLETTRRFAWTEDVELHILELPKFTKAAEELSPGLDIWLYFLRYAAKMNTEALPAALRQPLIVRAFEELKMLTQDQLERERYEARLKAQFDRNTLLRAGDRRHEEGLQEGLQQGREQGRALGEKIGMIHAYEQLLNLPQTPDAELAALSLEELTSKAEKLQQQLSKRT